MGTLYYGDNLDILRRYLKDESVDLADRDLPFNVAQNYNAFFHETDGTDAASQIDATEKLGGDSSAVPAGTPRIWGMLYPAINGWAIFVARRFRNAITLDENSPAL